MSYRIAAGSNRTAKQINLKMYSKNEYRDISAIKALKVAKKIMDKYNMMVEVSAITTYISKLDLSGRICSNASINFSLHIA